MNQLWQSTTLIYKLLLLLVVVANTRTSAIIEGISNRHMNVSSRTAFVAGAFLKHARIRLRSSLYHSSDVGKQAQLPSDFADIDYTLKERNPYDVHVYFSNEEQREEALILRQTMAKHFSWMRFYQPKSRPLGPHPVPMWEADFGGYENHIKLGEVCVYLQREHGSLSVLIHPHSMDGDYADHTRHALWFGEVLDLRIGGWSRD